MSFWIQAFPECATAIVCARSRLRSAWQRGALDSDPMASQTAGSIGMDSPFGQAAVAWRWPFRYGRAVPRVGREGGICGLEQPAHHR
jgi:hypothetical protein